MAIKLQDNQCSHCDTRDGTLSTCAGCKVVKYCSRAHQTADWPSHKIECTPIKKARNKVDKEERLLREEEPDIFEDDSIGHFWGLVETRPYMRARAALIDELSEVKTRQAVQNALDLALENLKLCRSDNMGTRSLIPALMIRVGQDQEAYDFIKWYETAGQDSHYDWGNMSNPFLDLHNEDLFEDIDNCQRDSEFGELAFSAALTLVKFRLLSDLRSLKASMLVGTKVPQEILDAIQENLFSNAISRNSALVQDVRDGKDIQPHIDAIEQQTNEMFARVHKLNKHFWPTLPKAAEVLDSMPQYYSPGDPSEAHIMLIHTYSSFEETPGAIDWVKKKVKELKL